MTKETQHDFGLTRAAAERPLYHPLRYPVCPLAPLPPRFLVDTSGKTAPVLLGERAVSDRWPVDPQAPAMEYLGGVTPLPHGIPSPGNSEENAKAPVGLRFNKGKPMMTCLDPGFLREMAKVMTKGAEKYARDNWRKGLPLAGIHDCLLRHELKSIEGDDVDEETGCDHEAHVAVNAMFAWWMRRNRPDLNDLYTKEG